MTLGKRIREARNKMRLTQGELAKRMGIDDTTISKYENDRSEADIDTLTKLSKLGKVNLHWLLTGDGNPDLYTEIDEQSELILKEFNELTNDDKDYVLEFIRRLKRPLS